METLSSSLIIQVGAKKKSVKEKPMDLKEDRPYMRRVVQCNYKVRSKKMEPVGEDRISSTSTERVPKKQKEIIRGKHCIIIEEAEAIHKTTKDSRKQEIEGKIE